MPPKSLQRLHCRCTVENCGKNFDNIADLHNHMNTTHAEILDIPVSLAQGESQEFSTRMMHGAIITTVVRDIEKSSMNGAKKEHEHEHEHVHPPTPPAEEEISAVLGKGKEKATEARPKLARWASNMNRNAMANPGASLWKSLQGC